jgi:hypothetical protein
MPGERADPYPVGARLDVAQFRVQVVDVDEIVEISQPQLHHRQQAVPAGDQPRRTAQPFHQADGMIHIGGSLVLERCRHLHVAPPQSVKI